MDKLRTGLTLKETTEKSDRTKNGSRDKQTNERTTILQCPECGKHALQVTPSTGRFFCWNCGIYGHFTDVEGDERTAKAPTTTAAQRLQQAYSSLDDGHVSLHVEDYMPLSDFEAAQIVDLYAGTDDELAADQTLDNDQRRAQQMARTYLHHMGITLDVARRERLGVAQRFITTKDDEKAKSKGMLRECIAYRNYIDGYLTNVKFRCITAHDVTSNVFNKSLRLREFEKGFEQLAAFTPCAPYGIDVLNPAHGLVHDTLYVCEGEKDCLTLRSLGFLTAISVPSGANTDLVKAFQAFRQWLEPIHRVFVVGDQDDRGRPLAKKLVEFFDAQDVFIAQWDQRLMGKDISDVRIRMGDDIARALVRDALRCQTDDVCEYTATHDEDRIADYALGLTDPGYDLHLGSLMNQHFRLTTSGGLIIITGVPGSGKSDWINFFATTQMAFHDDHVCFCSFEEPDKHRHLHHLTQIWVGATPTAQLSREQLQPYIHAVTSHVTHLDLRRERPTYRRVLRRAESVLARNPNLRHLIIDPYLYLTMTEGQNITETEAIKQMLTAVQDWGHQHHVWITIVAHPRKMTTREGSEDYEEINFYTLSGSAHWANVADFLISVKRCTRNGVPYTEYDALKVRFQEFCHPGKVCLKRNDISRRYAERANAEDCMVPRADDDAPWQTIINP